MYFWLIGIGVAVGIGLRIWTLLSPLAAVDADEAIAGLMAMRILDGELSPFYWGQAYGGTQEIFLTAGLFALAGPGWVTLKVVPIVLYAGASLLTWRIGRRTIGEPAASVAGLLVWVWPAYCVWRSTKGYSFYAFGLATALFAILLVLRLKENGSRLDAVMLGLTVGLAWWATPLTLTLIAPACLWLLLRKPGVVTRTPVMILGAVVGALPWLILNLRNHWYSLELSPPLVPDNTYINHVVGFFASGLPAALGLRISNSDRWVTGEVAGWTLYAISLAAFIWLLWRRPKRTEILLLVALLYPFILAMSPFAWYYIDPRYLFFLMPIVALLFATLAHGFRSGMAVLLVGVIFSITGLVAMMTIVSPDGPTETDPPKNYGVLLEALEAHKIDRVYASYWMAYPITFLTNEEVVAASWGHVRYDPYNELVENAANPSYVLVKGTPTAAALSDLLTSEGVSYRKLQAGEFVVYTPSRKMSLESLQPPLKD